MLEIGDLLRDLRADARKEIAFLVAGGVGVDLPGAVEAISFFGGIILDFGEPEPPELTRWVREQRIGEMAFCLLIVAFPMRGDTTIDVT